MNKKAVKIDLSTFFDDERKMTFVLIDPNWKSVECLQKRIEYLFGVESVRFLSDGYFLPPQESIEIVKFCNDLKAFVPKEILEERKKKKTKKTKNIEKSKDLEESSNEDVTTVKSDHINNSQKKRKSTSLANEAKRTKSSLLSEITSTSETIQSTTPKFVEPNDEISKSKKFKLSKDSLITTNYEEQQTSMEYCSHLQDCNSENATNLEEEENTLVQGDSIKVPKNRLTSTPKERKTSEIVEDDEQRTFNDELKMTVTRHSSIPSSTFLNESKMPQQHGNTNLSNSSSNTKNPFKKPKSSRAHIYFNDAGEIENPSTRKTNEKSSILKNDNETKTIVIFRCPLSDTTNDKQKPRVFNLQTTNNANKQVVEIQEHVIILPQTNESSSPSKETFMLNGQDNKENDKVVVDMESSTGKSCLNNTTNTSDDTTIANNTNKAETTDISPTTTNESQLQQTTTTIAATAKNKTSVMSMDCVDLSLDLDEYDKKEQNRKKSTANISKSVIEEKHDLTRDDDEDNNSSTSDVEEISEVIDLNDTEDNYEDSINNSTICPTNMKNIKVNKILPFCVNINDMPNIGNIILFKMRYFNKKQKHIETNYIAGKAEYINRRTKSIKLFIIDGASELDHLPNQFICNLDESQDNIKYIQVKFSEMLQPKLFTSY
ncbi:coilin isoform 2-T2 [Cochliomyia hominivorax]